MDLTVDPHRKVVAHPGYLAISTDYAVHIICPDCGDLRNTLFYDDTTREGILPTGSIFRHCHCKEPAQQYPSLQVMQR